MAQISVAERNRSLEDLVRSANKVSNCEIKNSR